MVWFMVKSTLTNNRILAKPMATTMEIMVGTGPLVTY